MGYATFTKFVLGLLFIAVLAAGGVQIWARTAPTPGDIGPVDGALRPCTSTGNCVNSQSEDEETTIRPLSCGLLGGEALLDAVAAALASLPRTSIENEAGKWVHAVSATAFFGFKDDVELLLSSDGRVVHVRSESRLGSGDMGVNRQRVEDLRTALASTC